LETILEQIWETFDNEMITKNPHQQGWQGSL